MNNKISELLSIANSDIKVPEPEEPKERLPSMMRDEEVIEYAKSTLNEDQLISFDGIVDFLSDPDKEMVTVIGYAGTGKTYLISKIVTAVDGAIAMTAPTNKAVKVLSDNRNEEMKDVVFATIHKLLALRLKWVHPRKGQSFVPYQKLTSVWKKEPTLHEYKVLIVDEVSMLDDELFFLIKTVKQKSLKVIFLGDAAQIPPVGKPDSIPLMEKDRAEHNIGLFRLDKTMRQKEGSAILKTATSIRDNRFGRSDTIKERVTTSDVVFTKRFNADSEKDFQTQMLTDFISTEFVEDPNYCKVISWTNDTVDIFNKMIREFIYKTEDLSFIMPGEKLIADTPVIRKSKAFDYMGNEIIVSKIIFNTSDEFTVVSFEEKVWTYSRPDSRSEREDMEQLKFDNKDFSHVAKNKSAYSMPYYETIVEYDGYKEKIDILHPAGEKPLQNAIDEIFRMKMYPEYEVLIERFAKVKYNYAITAHKSQGSTYKNVYVIEDDIDSNPRTVERNRIKYTAVSRASDKLYILSKRN